MKKILYVVHRYAPFSGGSENHIRDLAEETVSQGYDVTVFAGEHKGDLNGVKLTNNQNIIYENFDLIVVHGGDVYIQNFVLINAKKIKSPILYLLILPSKSEICLQALQDVKYIGCCTNEDWEHVNKFNVGHKSIKIPISINQNLSIGKNGFKKKFGITTKNMFLSSGGFWPHKGMDELCDVFSRLPIKDTTLVLTGYQNKHFMPKTNSKIKCLLLDNRQDVLNAMLESDLYIMNSFQEGFGMVLLECMLNKASWISRDLAGANLMKNYGIVFENKQDMMKKILDFKKDENKLNIAYDYVINNHTAKKAVEQILNLLK